MIDTRQDRWLPGPARLKAMPLHEFTGERVALMKWLPGEQSQSHRHRGGEEIDPVLLAMSPQAFTLTGSECIEGVEGVDFAQSWLVRDA